MMRYQILFSLVVVLLVGCDAATSTVASVEPSKQPAMPMPSDVPAAPQVDEVPSTRSPAKGRTVFNPEPYAGCEGGGCWTGKITDPCEKEGCDEVKTITYDQLTEREKEACKLDWIACPGEGE